MIVAAYEAWLPLHLRIKVMTTLPASGGNRRASVGAFRGCERAL
jgi:hypothetical protein